MTKATSTGDGVTSRFSFSFPYVLDSDVRVSVDGVDLLTSQYALFGTSEMDITDGAAVIAANGLEIAVYRYSDGDIPNTTFQPGPVRSKDLNEAIQQAAFIAEEGRATADAASLVADNADANADIAIAAIAAFSGGGTTSLVVGPSKLTYSPVGDTKIAYLEDDGKFYVLFNTGYASFVDVNLAKTWYAVGDDFIGDLEASNNLSEVDPAAARTNLNVPGLGNAANTFSGRLGINDRARVGSPDIDAHLGATPPALVAAEGVNVSHTWAPAIETELMVIRNGNCAIDIVANTATSSFINFGTQASETSGQIEFDHAVDDYLFKIAGTTRLTLSSTDLIHTGGISATNISGSWIATQSEAEAGIVNDQVMTPLKTAQAIAAQVTGGNAQATCFFDSLSSGTPSIKSSSNISSITDTSVGYYTMNFTTAMPTANYTVLANAKGSDNTTVASGANSIIVHPISYATGSVALVAYTQSNLVKADATLINFAVFL